MAPKPSSRGPLRAPLAEHAVSDPAEAAAAAFVEGDFLRARALGQALLHGPAAPKLTVPLRQALEARARALSVDPFVVRLGLGTAGLYAAAWIYALAQR